MSKFSLLKRTPSGPKGGGTKVFGVSLDQLVEQKGSAIPDVVHQSVKCIEKGIETSALFATAAKKVKVQLLRKQVEGDSDPDLSKSKDTHEVAEILRSFFMELVDPLLSFKLYDSFLSIARMEIGEGKLQRLHATYNALPTANRVILGFIFAFFRKCLEYKKNQTTPIVIGKFFGPAILRPRGDISAQETSLVAALTAYMIDEFPNLLKMSSRQPDSPSQSTPQDPFKTPSSSSSLPATSTPTSSRSNLSTTYTTSASSSTNPLFSASTNKNRPPTSASNSSPRHAVASPRGGGATSPVNPMVSPRSSPTLVSPSNTTKPKPAIVPSTTTAPVTKKAFSTATNSTPTPTPASTTTPGSQIRRGTASTPSTTSSPSPSPSTASPMGSSVRTTAQNIHQMQQAQLMNRLSQIKALNQQRSDQQKEKEQKEKEQKEREQKEREQKEVEVQRREKEEKEKREKGNPANYRLQRPAICRMKANYDFEARDDTEITILVGGLVDVVSKDDSGWWWGRVVDGDGKVGLFPSNYCEIVETFSVSVRKFNISQLNLNPKIRDLQKECGFVKETQLTSQTEPPSQLDEGPTPTPIAESPLTAQFLVNTPSSLTRSPSSKTNFQPLVQTPSLQVAPKQSLTHTPSSLTQSPSSETTNPTDDLQKTPSSQKTSPRKNKSLKIEELQKSMSKLKGFPGAKETSSPPLSPISPKATSSPPLSPSSLSFGTSLKSPISSFSRISPSQSFTKGDGRLQPSLSLTKTPTSDGDIGGHRITHSSSFSKSPSSSPANPFAGSDGHKLISSASFGKSSAEANKLVQSRSFKGGEEEPLRLVPSASFSKRSAATKDGKRKLKARKDRKSQTIEDLQNIMADMRGFPSTPEAVRARMSHASETSFALQKTLSKSRVQLSESEPTYTLQKTPSKSRIPSSRESEPANALQKIPSKSRIPSSRIADGAERFSPSSKEMLDSVIDSLNREEGEEAHKRSSTPLHHLTLNRAKPTKRRPASIGSLRKLHSTHSMETAEVVHETLQLLDAEVQKRQEMEALANEFRKEYEEEKKLRNQLEDENQFSSNLFDKLKAELEQQQHSVNMLHYEKDALESMTRQLKREAMSAVSKYEEVIVSKSSMEKEMEEMRKRIEELANERDVLARERDKFKHEAANMAEDFRSAESRNRLEKSNTLEELSISQKLALDLQAQLITSQKTKAEVQSKLEQALKELELSRERDAKLLSSIQNERAELDRLRNTETEKLHLLKSLEEQKAALEAKVNTLKDSCKEEQILRKKYFNIIEDMKGKIRVMCRTRPLADKEARAGQKMACEFADPYTITISSSNQTKSFGFDRVFDPSTSQDEVFSDTSHLVQSSLDGYNVCIFAYGQTGSGKTHSLLGDESNPGLCPRAMTLLYDSIKRDEGRFKVSVRCYLLELYNDNLVDLLLKRDEKPTKLIIKKDAKGMVYVENATMRKASSAEKLRSFLMQGLKHRHTGATKMNDLSSRSHLIFSILIKSKNLQTKQHSTGKLSFVDLAGSERAARSGATDERLQEAKSINKSLSALGNVINALSTGESFVPYRNNKLTQLMSDSIGGNAKTLMLVNVAPGDANADESLQSLAYGQRAKLITNTATKMVETAEVQRLKKIIATLRAERGEPAEQDEVLEVALEPNGADEDPLSDID